MMWYRSLAVITAALLAAGCASYAPPKLDEKTGSYKATGGLKPGAVEQRDTDVDLEKFRFVYLVTQSNVYPGRFEFFTRAALVRAGFTHILSTQELGEFVTSTPELSSVASITDPVSLRRLSDAVGPVLFVQVSSMWDGDVTRDVTFHVADLSTGKTLLSIRHNRLVWMEVDGEAHYPVLNEFKKWVEECAPAKETI